MGKLREIQIKDWDELVKDSIRTDSSGDLYFSDGSCFVESMKKLCGKNMMVTVDNLGRTLYNSWLVTPHMYYVIDDKPEGPATKPVFAKIKDFGTLGRVEQHHNISRNMRKYTGQVLPVEVSEIDCIGGLKTGDFMYEGEVFTKDMYDIVPEKSVTVIRIKTWAQLHFLGYEDVYGDLVGSTWKVTQSMRLFCGRVFNVVLNEDGSVNLGDFTFAPDTFDIFEEIRYIKPDTLRRLTAQQ